MPAKQHDFTATEIRAGILVLVSLATLIAFFAVVKGWGPSDDTAKTFHAYFTDIAGLNNGADVRFGGVLGGRVKAVKSDPDDHSRIRVTVEVAGHIPVNEGSIATIEQTSLTAEKHLEISTGEAESAVLESGATLQSGTAGGFIEMPDLDQLLARLESLLDGFITLVGVDPSATGDEMNEVVDLADILSTLDRTLDEGAAAAGGVNQILQNNRTGIKEAIDRLVVLEATTSDLMVELKAMVEENRGPVRETFASLQGMTGELNSRVEELATTLQSTLLYLRDTGGNSSALIDQQRPAIEEILSNLQETTRNLREFSRILADQPQALIRGKDAQGRKNEGAK